MNIIEWFFKRKQKKVEIEKEKEEKPKIDQNIIYTINYKIKKSIKILILLLTISFVAVLIVSKNQQDTSKLYLHYYHTAELYGVTRSANMLDDAYYSYIKKDFQTAYNLFGNLIQKDSSNNYIRFYYSICAIETGNVDIAINNLSILVENSNLFTEYSEWYLALCYLKKSDYGNTKLWLSHIISEKDNPYKKQALELMKKLQ